LKLFRCYSSWQATGSPAINIEFAATVLATDSLSIQVNRFKGVRSLGNVRSAGYSIALGAKATTGLASDEINSTFPESPAHFPHEGRRT
jgi:hypothetical protein